MKMSYHQDNVKRQKKIKFIVFLLVAGVIFYFFSSFILGSGFKILSFVSVPVWRMQNGAKDGVGAVSSAFRSKRSLEDENTKLQKELDSVKLQLDSYASLQRTNEELMRQMGRRVATTSGSVIAAVLSGPNIPPYDSLIIDAGRDQGISAGDRVIYEPNIVLGEISQVYSASSNVKLYSSDGSRTDVLVPTTGPTHAVAIGFGGGNFYIELPSSIMAVKGMRLLIPGSDIYVLGFIDYIQVDPITSMQRILAKYSVNIKNVRFVHVLRTISNEYLD